MPGRPSPAGEVERQQTKRDAAAEIGPLSKRELFLVGVSLHWAEGTKAHGGQERVTFINSDPDMINTFLAWLRLLDVGTGHLRFHGHIHESADVPAAEQFWAELVGEGSTFGKATLKKHKPQTNRQNTGVGYHGCLTIRVNKSASLCRRIEGWRYGIVLSASPAT